MRGSFAETFPILGPWPSTNLYLTLATKLDTAVFRWSCTSAILCLFKSSSLALKSAQHLWIRSALLDTPGLKKRTPKRPSFMWLQINGHSISYCNNSNVFYHLSILTCRVEAGHFIINCHHIAPKHLSTMTHIYIFFHFLPHFPFPVLVVVYKRLFKISIYNPLSLPT